MRGWWKPKSSVIAVAVYQSDDAIYDDSKAVSNAEPVAEAIEEVKNVGSDLRFREWSPVSRAAPPRVLAG